MMKTLSYIAIFRWIFSLIVVGIEAIEKVLIKIDNPIIFCWLAYEFQLQDWKWKQESMEKVKGKAGWAQMYVMNEHLKTLLKVYGRIAFWCC